MMLKKILSCLNTNKAVDHFPAKCPRKDADVLAYPFSKIINLSEKKLFPEQCKIAKLKLLFKKGSKTDPTDRSLSYRPIHF